MVWIGRWNLDGGVSLPVAFETSNTHAIPVSSLSALDQNIVSQLLPQCHDCLLAAVLPASMVMVSTSEL